MDVQNRNPYERQPSKAFWRSAVGSSSAFDISHLWAPKHDLTREHRIVTAGSCFAQHIGRALQRSGYRWFDAEPAPASFGDEVKKAYNYGVFSFRTGNIYTASALRQWVAWALGHEPAPEESWEKDGRFYDPFRPNIEPDGFDSADAMLASRNATLAAIRQAIAQGDRFVFTMGLTEGWLNTEKGYTYAMCPGTVAGTFDPAMHEFRNFGFTEIRQDMREAIRMIREARPSMRFLLTISPVPLTATATTEHVLVATTHSKSVLRAIAGEMVQNSAYIDYFPSYEIITAPAFRGMFYEPNMRSVHPDGVAFVMRHFFAGLGVEARPAADARDDATPSDSQASEEVEDDVVCEEALLDAFGRK